jgi:hypothetical protein
MNLSYEWAIKTKRQGGARDYRVLGRTPGEISEQDFGAIFRALSIGELPDEADPYNPPAPWLAFGFFAGPQTHYLACVRYDWTALRDAGNRPVSYASCLCLPFKQVAQAQLSLSQIARLHDSLNLPDALNRIASSSGDEVLPLECARLSAEKPLPLDALADKIDAAGFEYCASIAATFLAGPVVLVGGKPAWEDSLNHLEAILALLPYGARANTALSSWMRTATMNLIRLSFSSGPSRDKEYVAWLPQPGAARPAPSPKIYQPYFNLLLEARKKHPTLEILQHLAACPIPLSFETPEAFISILQDLDRPALILASIRAAGDMPKPALQADIRAFLKTDQAQQLNPADRLAMLRYLLAVGSDPLNPPVLAKNWVEDLWKTLVTRAVLAFSQESLPALLYCLEVAREMGRSDQLFENFLDEKNLADKHNRSMIIQWAMQALKAAPDLGRDALFAQLTITPLPPEFSLEWAQCISRENPVDKKDNAIFLRLCDARNSQFAPRAMLVALRLLDEVLDVEALNEITRTDPGHAAYLCTVALNNRCFHNLALGISQWLLNNTARPTRQEFQNTWESLFKQIDLNLPNLDPAPCANLDVVWLNFSGSRQPLWLNRALQAQAEVFNPYSRAFSAAVGRPAVDRANVVRNLDAFATVFLQRALQPFDYHRLGLFIEDVNQTLNDERLTMTQQKNRIRECLNAPAKTSQDLADCCKAILNDKRLKDAPDVVVSQLVEARYKFPPRGVEDLLDQLSAHLPRKLHLEFENKLIAAVLAEKFGPELARTYQETWRETIVWEIGKLAKDISLLNPKDPAFNRVSTEIEAKLGPYLPKKGGFPRPW